MKLIDHGWKINDTWLMINEHDISYMKDEWYMIDERWEMNIDMKNEWKMIDDARWKVDHRWMMDEDDRRCKMKGRLWVNDKWRWYIIHERWMIHDKWEMTDEYDTWRMKNGTWKRWRIAEACKRGEE